MEGETSTTLNVTMSPIQVTDKDSNDYDEFLAGVRGWSFDFAARGDTGSSAQDGFIDDMIATTQVLSKVEWKTFDSNKYTGDFYATSLSISSAFDGAIEVTGTGTGTGAITQAAA